MSIPDKRELLKNIYYQKIGDRYYALEKHYKKIKDLILKEKDNYFIEYEIGSDYWAAKVIQQEYKNMDYYCDIFPRQSKGYNVEETLYKICIAW